MTTKAAMRRNRVERIEDWDEARYSIIPPRAALDLRLTLVHFRVLAYLGRVNTQEGWCELSQTAVAQAWGLARQTVNIAVGELVAWGYLQKRGQKQTSSARCHYRVLIDEPEPENGEEDVSSPGDTPQAETCHLQVTPVSSPEVTPVSPNKDTPLDQRSEITPLKPPEGGARGDDAPDGGQGKPSRRRRRDRAAEVEALLERVATTTERKRIIDWALGPLCRRLAFEAPNPEFALGYLADWLAVRVNSQEQARRIVDHVAERRRVKFLVADVEKAAFVQLHLANGWVQISRATSPKAVRAWIEYGTGHSDDSIRTIAYLLGQHGMAVVPSEFPPAKEVKAA